MRVGNEIVKVTLRCKRHLDQYRCHVSHGTPRGFFSNVPYNNPAMLAEWLQCFGESIVDIRLSDGPKTSPKVSQTMLQALEGIYLALRGLDIDSLSSTLLDSVLHGTRGRLRELCATRWPIPAIGRFCRGLQKLELCSGQDTRNRDGREPDSRKEPFPLDELLPLPVRHWRVSRSTPNHTCTREESWIKYGNFVRSCRAFTSMSAATKRNRPMQTFFARMALSCDILISVSCPLCCASRLRNPAKMCAAKWRRAWDWALCYKN